MVLGETMCITLSDRADAHTGDYIKNSDYKTVLKGSVNAVKRSTDVFQL